MQIAQAMGQPSQSPKNWYGFDPKDPSWYRADGSAKGPGFLGPLKTADGKTMSEYSIGVNVGGKDMEIPSIVPSLTPQQVKQLTDTGEMTPDIVRAAVAHALMRQQAGLPVFATEQDWANP